MDDWPTMRYDTNKGENRCMVNKKGYIKTLEAVIAIIMIIMVGYVLIPMPEEKSPEVPLAVKGVQKIIDQSIQFNDQIRANLTVKELTESEKRMMLEDVKRIIDKYAPKGYDYTCAVCSNPGMCLADYTPLEKSVYMTDVLVASSKAQQNPKVVRIWFWNKPTLKEDQSKIMAYNSCMIK